VAGGAADEQQARAPRRVVVLALGGVDAFPGLEPFDGQLEIRVGELRSRLPLARAPVVLVVCLPGDLGDFVDLPRHGVERRVEEPPAKPDLELRTRDLDVSLPFSYFRCTHAVLHSLELGYDRQTA
jgi:hypothetical protein